MLVFLLLLAGITFGAAPIAPHLTTVADVNGEVVVQLSGYDEDGDSLRARISVVPSTGSLHQLSQVFSDYGYDPKIGSVIGSNLTLVTGSRNRVVYAVPKNVNPPSGAWATFRYTVHDGTTQSEDGIVWVLPPHGRLVWSDFSTGSDGWTISSNGASGSGLVWEPYSRGLLNRYVIATDDEVRVDAQDGADLTQFRFVAPSKFLGNHVTSYGGAFHVTIGTSAGDFASASDDLRVVELECDTCDSGRGIRLARFASQGGFPTDGTEAKVSISLIESEWRKDPKNSILEWTPPTQCELVEVLSGLTRVSVLGDLTRWFETVAIDDVGLTRGTAVPIACADIYY